jgi:tetratricopeptide (TPR) repeat protein
MTISFTRFLALRILPLVCSAAIGLAGGLAGTQADEALIRSYSQEAEQAMAAKDLQAAARALEKLSRLAPDSAEVYADLGMVYYTQNRYREAAGAFRRATQLNPKIPNGELMLALCDVELGNWDRARPILESAFRSPPSQEVGRTIGIKLMETYSELDQHIKALELSEELIQRYPEDPEILYRASHLYGDRALATMSRLVGVAPRSPWKVMAFGEALEAQKRHDLAIIQFQKVIEAAPDMPGAHYRLGRALLLDHVDSEQARDEALKQFQAELAIDPRNAGAEYEMGEIYRRRGDSEQATGHFLRAAEMDPRFEQAQIAVARTFISSRKPKEALPHLAEAIKVNPDNEVSHFFLAKAYKALGDEASSERETALYRECHARALPGDSSDQAVALSDPATTQQTVDPDAAASAKPPVQESGRIPR